MKRILISSLISLSVIHSLFAQSEDNQVVEVINRLFKGMQLADSAMVHSAFYTDVTMATSFRNRDNTPMLRRESSIQAFLNAVGTPHADAWNEEIWDVEVRIDGELAQVWCNYAFYVGRNFSHCGSDAFHLYKGVNGWKIFHLADTRRTTSCKVPNEIAAKYASGKK